MKLLDFLGRESDLSWPALVGMAGVAGFSSIAILAVVNVAATQASHDSHSLRHLLLFGAALILYILSQRYVMRTAALEMEKILDRLRARVADRLRRCDLVALERLGRADIYASVNRETQTLSQAVTILAASLQSVLLTLFTYLYVGWLSPAAFGVSVVPLGLAIYVHARGRKGIAAALQEYAGREQHLFTALTDLLDGYKEVKLSRSRAEDLFEHLATVSASAKTAQQALKQQFITQGNTSLTIFYLALAAVVFLVPQLSATYPEVVVKAVTAVLFSVGSVSGIIGALPRLAEANAASAAIMDLEARLTRTIDPSPSAGPGWREFREIAARAVQFHHTDPAGSAAFTVGPIDLTLVQGELLFIAGGNGSGKSTLLKLLTGLYRPMDGVLRVDGGLVTAENVAAYRQLFAAVFADFHLFKPLYGLDRVDPARLEALLKEMEIAHKTRFDGRRFETLELSTGQRKRLALVVALLEDRPIMVFDEWAADQDPAFRAKFYRELLPGLKAQGKTVLAVTHDDRYYAVADRVLKMEEGRIVEELPGAAFQP